MGTVQGRELGSKGVLRVGVGSKEVVRRVPRVMRAEVAPCIRNVVYVVGLVYTNTVPCRELAEVAKPFHMAIVEVLAGSLRMRAVEVAEVKGLELRRSRW